MLQAHMDIEKAMANGEAARFIGIVSVLSSLSIECSVQRTQDWQWNSNCLLDQFESIQLLQLTPLEWDKPKPLNDIWTDSCSVFFDFDHPQSFKFCPACFFDLKPAERTPQKAAILLSGSVLAQVTSIESSSVKVFMPNIPRSSCKQGRKIQFAITLILDLRSKGGVSTEQLVSMPQSQSLCIVFLGGWQRIQNYANVVQDLAKIACLFATKTTFGSRQFWFFALIFEKHLRQKMKRLEQICKLICTHF